MMFWSYRGTYMRTLLCVCLLMDLSHGVLSQGEVRDTSTVTLPYSSWCSYSSVYMADRNQVFLSGGVPCAELDNYDGNGPRVSYAALVDLNTWGGATSSAVADKPTATWLHAQVYYNGKVYCIAGHTAGHTGSVKVEIYDLDTDTWSTGPDYPAAIGSFKCAMHLSTAFCAGGYTWSFKNNAYSIDLSAASPSWTTLPSLNTARTLHGMVYSNGYIYVIGGYGPGHYQYPLSPESLDVSNPTSWKTTSADIPDATLTPITIWANGKVYAISGVGTPRAVKHSYIWADDTNPLSSWTRVSVNSLMGTRECVNSCDELFNSMHPVGLAYSSDVSGVTVLRSASFASIELRVIVPLPGVTCAVNTYASGKSNGDCTACPTGTTAAAIPTASATTFCEGIAAGYYGTAGVVSGTGAKHAVVTVCTATFSHSSTGGGAITSAVSATTTTKTACVTAPGYIITSADGAADGAITVAPAAAGTYAAGGTALLDSDGAGRAAESATNCAPGKYSAAGAASCTDCATGKTNDAGSAFCGKVAAGYYGTVGSKSGSTYTSHAGAVTACTATFSHSSTGGGAITSAVSATTTTKTACVTAPGYIITSADGAADGAITVAPAAAGTYAAGGTALLDSDGAGRAAESATNCAPGKYSAAGAASCTDCPTGKTNDAGSAFCGKVAAGYYGTVGSKSGSTFTSHAGAVTACTATYTHNSIVTSGVAGITSDESATTTDKTACKTKPGYRITTAANLGDANVAIAKAAAGSYIAGGTALPGTGAETATACPYGGTTTATGQDAVTSCTPACGSGTNAAAHQGTCRCAANFYGDPKDTNGNEVLVVTQGCTACPYGGTANAGSAAVTSCTPACGSGTNAAAHQGTCRCAANFYGDPKDTNGNELLVVTQGCTACPYGGTANAGSAAVTSCTPACGSGTNAAAHQGTCRCAANFYGDPKDTNGNELLVVTQGCTACPYGGTANAGSAAVTSCTPACGSGTNAAAHQGTCRCAANFYGDPKDTNGNELLVVTQGCTACPYGGTANAGSAAVTSCTPACGSGTNAAAHQGTCRCAANFYGDPKDTNGNELLVVTQGCTACPYGGTANAGSAAVTSCTPACGSGTNAAAHQGTCRCAANFYGDPKDTNGNELLVVTQGCTACPYGGTANAGSAAVTSCTPACGSGTNAAAHQGTCRCAANFYGDPKDTNGNELLVVTQGCTACPYGGTANAGSAAVTSCTPDCNSAYAAVEANAGTCRCKANYYGTPKDSGDGNDAKPTKGCRCVTNYYVLSNTCTACESGLFRIEGDDPGGANTECTYASPFASNTQLKDTIASSYCLGGSDAAGANCTDGKGMYIAQWDTSLITDMTGLFEDKSSFNADIGGWNTGSVTSMHQMFNGATVFNQDISSWDVSDVADMYQMFGSASSFNQDVSAWNTAAVTDMSGMFESASAFNQAVGDWATGRVTDMSSMFRSASEFNQDISSWSVASVVNMQSMFSSASSFNKDITGWVLADSSTSTDMFLSATAWVAEFARTDGEDTTDGPPSKWGEPCGNGWYDANFQEQCEPRVNGIEVKGCDPSTCEPLENWKCDDPSSLRPGDEFNSAEFSYNCTCDNPAGTYAIPLEECERKECVYGERCLADGLGCAPGAGGNACDRCLTAADIAELPLNEGSSLSKNGYYKTGQMCTACPETSAGQLFAAAAVVVVLAFCGFKASQLMGAQATNNLKKIVESLQFFSLSLSMSIKWPGPVLNLGKYLEAFTFSIEFLRPECVATGLNWLNIFLSSVFFVPALIFIIIVVNNRRAKHRYKTTVRAIDSERHEDGETVYWIEKPGFLWGTRRAYESKGGDKIVRELQRQYRFRAALRSFGVLSLTILYLPIVRMCLQSYDCIKIDGVNGLRLEHDIDILCESEGHVIIQAAAAVMLAIVGIGMPIYVIMQVRKIRLSGKLDDPQTIDSYGPFYDVYRREELTHDHKLEIARIRQTAVESSSFRRGEGTSDERPFDAATDDIAEEIENEARVDTEEDSSDVDRVDVEDDSDTRPPQRVASGLGKLARALTMTKSALGRTTSAKARERAHRMHWKDRFALHYLAVELVQKSCVIITTSPLVAETAVSGWALVVVHWFIGAFVYVCQPWRIMTLGFGKYKVRNCLNKVESLAGFLQGLGPLLAMIFPVQRNELGEVKQTVTLSAITVLLTIIITGLLSIRIIVFVGERVAVKRKKMDIDKDPEKCMQNVHKQLVKFATNRAIVSMFAFKADFDIKRRKARARLEDTRQAMLSRVDILKSQQTDEDYSDKITALYEVANEMAHIVNTIVPQAPPTDLNAEGCIELLDEQLASILKDIDVRARANALDAPNFTAVHIVMKVHAFDTIIYRLDERLLEFAAAELVSELAELGRRHSELRHTRRCVAIGFGDADLRATFHALRSCIETLRHAVENDDFEAVFTTLNGGKEIIDSHLRWCRDQCEVFKSAEDEHPDFLEDEPPLTTEFFKATVKVIQSHEKQLSKFKSECIRNWPPLFKNFGRVKYIQGFAEQLQNQLHLDLNESTPEEAKAVFDQVLAFTDGFALWCGDLVAQVEGSDVFILFEPIARAMMESLKAIRSDAESQSALSRQALSTIDYAVTQRALAATTRSGLQTALADGTSALEDQLAAEITRMDAAKISLKTTFETEKMRIEEALNTLEQESDGRRAVLEDDIRSQQDTIARLQNLKREEAAASSSINPLKWERFSRSTELAEAVSALRMSKQNLKNEELANEKARGDARKAVHSLERGLKRDLVECDVRAKKIRDGVAKELKKQTLDAQRKTPEDAKAHKASLASRRAVFQQQRAAAKLIASESREATRIQAQLADYMRNLKTRES